MKKKNAIPGDDKNKTSISAEEGAHAVPDKRYDLQILLSLRRIIQAIDIQSRKLASKYNITGPQLICLKCIAEKGPLTSTQISKDIFLSTSTLVGIIDRLEKKELLKRERNHKDRRLVLLTITDKGRELLKNAPILLQKSITDSLANFSDLEQMTIALSLQRIVEMTEAEDIEAAPFLDTTKLDHKGDPAKGGQKEK